MDLKKIIEETENGILFWKEIHLPLHICLRDEHLPYAVSHQDRGITVGRINHIYRMEGKEMSCPLYGISFIHAQADEVTGFLLAADTGKEDLRILARSVDYLGNPMPACHLLNRLRIDIEKENKWEGI